MPGLVSPVQRRRLLVIPCPHCGARAGELCFVPTGHGDGDRRTRVRSRLPVRSLAGGCHDARWQAADLGPAPVVPEVVAAVPRRTTASTAVMERPW
jgi:hypothetical protein